MQPTTKITIFGVRLALVILGLYWLLIFTGTHLPKLPGPPLGTNDKTIHFFAYFLLVTLMCYSTQSIHWLRRFSAIGGIAMAYGAIDELTQAWVPNRSPDPLDYAADVAGICTAIALYVGAKCFYETTMLREPAE